MAEEIKIVVREQREGNAIAEEQARLQRLQQEIQKQHNVTPEYALKLAQRKIEAEKGNPAIEERRQRSASAVLDREKKITEEKERQAVIAGRPQSFGGGGAVTLGSGGAAGAGVLAGGGNALAGNAARSLGVAIGAAVTAAIVDHEARVSIENNDIAQRAINARGLRVTAARGNSSEALAEARAAEDRVFQRSAERPELQHQVGVQTFQGGLKGAAAGGTIGAGIGSLFPVIGTGVGAIVGGVGGGAYGAYTSWREGKRKLEAEDKAQRRDEEAAQQKREQSRQLFEQQEGKLELQMLRDRAKHTEEGNRALSEGQRKQHWLRTYKHMVELGASPEEAREAGLLEVGEDERQIGRRAASGIVNARSGADDIASAAEISRGARGDGASVRSWVDGTYAGLVTAENAVNAPVVAGSAQQGLGNSYLKSAIDAMHETVDKHLGTLVDRSGRANFGPDF